jgi:hypothetical protein
MITAMEFLILSLAVWRTAVLVTQDDGPARICAYMRAYFVPAGTEARDGSLGELVTCPYCLSVWLGIAVWLSWLSWPTETLLASLPLALAGAAAAVHKLTYDRPDGCCDPPAPPDQDSMLSG